MTTPLSRPRRDVGWLSFAELDAAAERFDRAVAVTPEIDRFCSSSAWILPARAAFAPDATPVVLETDAGFAALMALPVVRGVRAAFPLEASWGLASPFAGAAPEKVVAELFARLRERRPPCGAVHALVLSGIAEDGWVARALARHTRGRLVPAGPSTERVIADLRGGMEAFLTRRSAKQRALMRRARRAAAASGIGYERHVAFAGELDAIFARMVAIEERSWKAGADGGGMAPGPMQVFYRDMLPRLAGRGALRVVFVTRDGADLAYCFGGLFTAGDATVYRGLQASYDDAFARESPGVLAHLEMIQLLCEEGVAAYDLGTDMDYKRRWGEMGLRTVTRLVTV